MRLFKPTIHIVYALPPLQKKWELLNHVSRLIFRRNIELRHYKFFNWPKPISAPFSITYNLAKYLSNDYKIKLYSVSEKCDLNLGVNDLLIGHPWPDFKDYKDGDNCWKTFDRDQITNKIVKKYSNDSRIFVLMPFNHSLKQVGWLKLLFPDIKNFIAICGDIWAETLFQFPFHSDIKNFYQLNMSIDIEDYPFLKKKFNSIGNRKFLYIGRISEEKNIRMLEQLAYSIENFEGGYISNSSDEIKGWTKISNFLNLNIEFMSDLITYYDVLISPSNNDAQATTVLEGMAWGFAVWSTLESGYNHSSIFVLDKHDLEFNESIYYKIQNTKEEDLLIYQRENLELVRTKYSWKEFNAKLKNIIIN